MDTSRTFEDPDTTADFERTTLAAAFADRERAHDAIQRLHDEGFRETWLGITKSDDTSYSQTSAGTSADETRVEADNWFTRFFGEGDESLYSALVKHGVSEADARAAGSLPHNSAILTVDGENHPELAAQIISQTSGQLITHGLSGIGGSGSSTTSTTGAATSGGVFASGSRAMSGLSTDEAPYNVNAESATTGAASLGTVSNGSDNRYATDLPLATSGAAAAVDYSKYRAGKPVDDDTRIQLREERLRIDKERRLRGEATISKDVVSQVQEIDVPLVREELFIERRPVSGAVPAAGPIGTESEVVRVPLTEEKLNVTKSAVVTEEVVIGKRDVQEIGHVSETTRKEELIVQDVDTQVGSSQLRSNKRI